MWWIVLFAVLPWGVRSQSESGEGAPGTDPGAPSLPGLGKKLIWTTLVSSGAGENCVRDAAGVGRRFRFFFLLLRHAAGQARGPGRAVGYAMRPLCWRFTRRVSAGGVRSAVRRPVGRLHRTG